MIPLLSRHLLFGALLLGATSAPIAPDATDAPDARELPRYDRTLLLEITSETSANASFGDLDGDGHLDVVISNDQPSSKLVYLNDGKGRFTVGSAYGKPDWPMRNATVADMNGDGRPDVIAANRYGRTTGSNYICLNRGAGQFDANCIPFSAEPATTITAADFNGDGLPDLLVPHRNGGQSRLYLGAQDADLAKLRSVPFGPADAQIRIAEAADLDGDGHLDVVTIDEAKGVMIYMGRGGASFAEPHPLGDRSVIPYALTIADLDRDGRAGMRFTPIKFGDDKGVAYGIAVGDFNGDARPDIAVARSEAPNALYFASGPAQPAAQQPTPQPTQQAGQLRLTYLGNAGWEITDGKTVVLVDPFLTQFARWRPGGTSDPAMDAPYLPDTALINQHVKRADYILITHGHSDHALDAGTISRRTGAVILGSETAVNLARAYDVPDSNLITVKGGEDYAFEGVSIRVVPSIHSALDDKRYFNNGRGIAGTAPRGLRAPLRRRDYQEGGSFAYLIRIGGHEVLAMGSMNYLEREMEGLRPNIALVGANSQRLEIHDFTGRLMRALGYPALVIPSHADGYGNPNPGAAALADRKRFVEEVNAASPASRVIVPTWFEPLIVPARASAQTAASAGRAGERRRIDPPGLVPLVPAYSVAIRDGDLVFVSGMTGVKPGTQEIIAGGVGAQTRQALENIRTSLVAAGATMADVGECTVYLTSMADYAAMNAVYIEFFPVDPPSRATLSVTAFPRPEASVEIKCSARIRGR